jgi:hypothetical protein
MVKPTRSPLLGYNHNVKYKGRIYHVQTEDSGPANPHLFTHLYYEGTILATRRQEYDGQAAEDIVKGLMQGQHKAILRDLKRGDLDGKLGMFFGSRGEVADIEGGDGFETRPSSFASATPTAPDAHLPEVVAFDLDSLPQGMPETPPPEPTAPMALPTAGPGIYAMKRPTIERAPLGDHYTSPPSRPSQPPASRPTRPSVSEQLLPLVIFDPPGSKTPSPRRSENTPPPVAALPANRPRVPSAVVNPLPARGSTPPPVPTLNTPPPVPGQARRPSGTPVAAQVVVQRTVPVGTPAPPSTPATARPRRPVPPIPYVVKEGSHSMAEGEIAPPRPLVPPPSNPPRTAGATPAAPIHDPISDKSLDEVILAYLSQGDSKE